MFLKNSRVGDINYPKKDVNLSMFRSETFDFVRILPNINYIGGVHNSTGTGKTKGLKPIVYKMSTQVYVYKKSRNLVALQVYIINFVNEIFGKGFVNTNLLVSDLVANSFETPETTKALAFSSKPYFFPIVNKVPSINCPVGCKILPKKSKFCLKTEISPDWFDVKKIASVIPEAIKDYPKTKGFWRSLRAFVTKIAKTMIKRIFNNVSSIGKYLLIKVPILKVRAGNSASNRLPAMLLNCILQIYQLAGNTACALTCTGFFYSLKPIL